MNHCVVFRETKPLVTAACLFGFFFSFTYQTPFHYLTHWEDNHARHVRHLRSDFSLRKDVRFIPLPVCLARSIGLKIVKSARLRTEMIFLPKHEVIYKIYGYKKNTIQTTQLC